MVADHVFEVVHRTLDYRPKGTILVQRLDVGIDTKHIRMSLHEVHESRDAAGKQRVVGVDDQEVFARYPTQAVVDRRLLSPILSVAPSREGLKPDKIAVQFQNLLRVVSARIVNHQILPVTVVLREHTVNRVRKKPPTVV